MEEKDKSEETIKEPEKETPQESVESTKGKKSTQRNRSS